MVLMVILSGRHFGVFFSGNDIFWCIPTRVLKNSTRPTRQLSKALPPNLTVYVYDLKTFVLILYQRL